MLTALLRNLAGGTRVALFLPVTRLAFRVDGLQFALLAFAGWGLGLAVDYVRTGAPEGAQFNFAHPGREALLVLLLLAVGGILARLWKDPGVALGVPVVVAATSVFFSLAMLAGMGSDAWVPLSDDYSTHAALAFFVWMVVAIVRAVAVGRSRPRGRTGAVVAGILTAGVLWGVEFVLPDAPAFETAGTAAADAGGHGGAISELALAAQPLLFYGALDALEDERPGVADVYFVGFSPYAGGEVFRREVDLARSVMDARFGSEGRSITLVNHADTLLAQPLATVTNLRLALATIGSLIDPEEDVVVVHLAGYATSPRELKVEFAPLELEALTPARLRRILDEAGIKWRVVIVSACYSGGFVEPLKGPTTLVVTASAADRPTGRCDKDGEASIFGDAYFNEALRRDHSFERAFRTASEIISRRERLAGIAPPSAPQIDVGAEMSAKLGELERSLGGRVGISTRFRSSR